MRPVRIHRGGQRGYFTLFAVFIITVLSVLGVYMAGILSTGTTASAMSIRREQAYFAARSGLEWAINRAYQGLVHDTLCSTGPATSTSFTMTGGATDGYMVTLSCDDQLAGGFDEAGVGLYEVDQMSVTARKGSLGNSGLVTHTVTEVVSSGN